MRLALALLIASLCSGSARVDATPTDYTTHHLPPPMQPEEVPKAEYYKRQVEKWREIGELVSTVESVSQEGMLHGDLVEESLRAFRGVVEMFHDQYKSLADFASSDAVKPYNKALARSIGKALKMVNGASTVTDFILIFFMESPNAYTNRLIVENFHVGIEKLDLISEKLERLEDNIKDHVYLKHNLEQLRDAEATILSAFDLYLQYQSYLVALNISQERQILNLKQEFKDRYRELHVEQAISSLQRLTTSDGILAQDIFATLREVNLCHHAELVDFYDQILDLGVKASLPMYLFYTLTARNSSEPLEELEDLAVEMHRSLSLSVKHCQRNTGAYALRVLQEPGVGGLSGRSLSQKLMRMFPHYSWAVMKHDSLYESLLDNHVRSDVGDERITLVYESSEESEEMDCSAALERGKSNLVVYNASHDVFVPEKAGFVTSDACPRLPFHGYDVVTSRERPPDPVSWFASARHGAALGRGSCSAAADFPLSKGQCYFVPFTERTEWVCDARYERDEDAETPCGRFVDSPDELTVVLAAYDKQLRLQLGVAKLADVYFQLKGLERKLRISHYKIARAVQELKQLAVGSSHELQRAAIVQEHLLMRFCSQYCPTLILLQHLARFNGIFLDLNEANSKELLSTQHRDLSGLLDRAGGLRNALAQIGKVLQVEYISAQKSYAHFQVSRQEHKSCTEAYKAHMADLKDELLLSQHAALTVMARHVFWLLDEGLISEVEKDLNLDSLLEVSHIEQEWKELSCPGIRASPDIPESHCSATDSLEGQSVLLGCADDGLLASHQSATCMRQPDTGRLRWFATDSYGNSSFAEGEIRPLCYQKWGPWAHWSPYDMDNVCTGYPISSRTRSCLNKHGQVVPDVSRCAQHCEENLSRSGSILDGLRTFNCYTTSQFFESQRGSHTGNVTKHFFGSIWRDYSYKDWYANYPEKPITGLQVRSGSRIYAMRVRSGCGSSSEWSPWYGGPGGSNQTVVDLQRWNLPNILAWYDDKDGLTGIKVHNQMFGQAKGPWSHTGAVNGYVRFLRLAWANDHIKGLEIHIQPWQSDDARTQLDLLGKKP